METPASGSTGFSGSKRRAKRDQQHSVELAEHLGDLRRFRAGTLIAVPTWLVFSILDWVAVRWGGAPSLTWMWTMRFGFVPISLWALWCVFKKPPVSARMLRVVDIVCYGCAAIAIALMAVPYGAIASPYLPGIMMVIVARGAFSAQHWKRALLPNVIMASSFPVVMAGAALFVRSVAKEMESVESRSTATHDLFFIYGTMVMVLAGTHYAWTLRRQLFESRSIGRYRLKERIGSGGMGEVWAAYHAGLKRDVALKMLRAEAAGDQTAVARFEREVKATSDLSHPNTIRVFDFGVTDDGIFYYAMELLDGETLADLVRRSGPLPCERAAHLVLQAARSLAEAHRNGIVHRDVKPANLFVTRAGGEPDFVKVLDFGIAKQEGADVELTTTGEIAGTPKYMAPEVVMGAPATPRADVYGLGAVLYLTLAGRAPFEGENASAIYVAHITEAPPLPSTVRGEPVLLPLEAIVLRCLEKDPSARYADAGELADAIADLDLAWKPRKIGSIHPPGPSVPANADDPTLTQVTITGPSVTEKK